MEYKDGWGNPLSKGEQLVIGAVEGTAAIHVAPLGVPFLAFKLGDKETSPLEKIAAMFTAAVEGVAYYWMIRRGIPAHYFLGLTNVVGTAAIGLHLLGLPDRMHDMINGGDYGGYSLKPVQLGPQLLELQLGSSPEKNTNKDPNVHYL